MSEFKAGQFAQYRDAEEKYTVLVLEDSTSVYMHGLVVHRRGYTIPDDELAYNVGDMQPNFAPSSFTRVKNPLKDKDAPFASEGKFYHHTKENFTIMVTGVKHAPNGRLSESAVIGIVVALGVWVPGQPDIGEVIDRPCGGHWDRVKNPLKAKKKKEKSDE